MWALFPFFHKYHENTLRIMYSRQSKFKSAHVITTMHSLSGQHKSVYYAMCLLHAKTPHIRARAHTQGTHVHKHTRIYSTVLSALRSEFCPPTRQIHQVYIYSSAFSLKTTQNTMDGVFSSPEIVQRAMPKRQMAWLDLKCRYPNYR